MACTLECVDWAAVHAGAFLRQPWAHMVNDFSCIWDSPPLSCLTPCLSSLQVLKSLLCLTFSLFLSLLPSLCLVVNTLLRLLLSACVDLTPIPFVLWGSWVTEIVKDLRDRRLAQSWEVQRLKNRTSCKEKRKRSEAEDEVRSWLFRSWFRIVEGEGFRGRGGWGRQRGACWLTPKVSDCLQPNSGRTGVSAAASLQSVQQWKKEYKLNYHWFI